MNVQNLRFISMPRNDPTKFTVGKINAMDLRIIIQVQCEFQWVPKLVCTIQIAASEFRAIIHTIGRLNNMFGIEIALVV